MTKIKNTKKGMAKKTLSMSLVVAMLATSNVPVWAAEFSDGSDAAVTSEAEAPSNDSDTDEFSDTAEAETPVVEDGTTADAAQADPTIDSRYDVDFKDMPSEMEWNKPKTVKIKVYDTVEKKDVTQDQDIKVRYLDEDGENEIGTYNLGSTVDKDGYASFTIDFSKNINTYKAYIGKKLRLQVINDAHKNEAGYAKTSDAFTLQKVTLKGSVSAVYTPDMEDGQPVRYTGKTITSVPKFKANNVAYTYSDGTNANVPISGFSEDANITGNDLVNAYEVSNEELTGNVAIKDELYRGSVDVKFRIYRKQISNQDEFAKNISVTLPKNTYEFTGAQIKVPSKELTATNKLSNETVKNVVGDVALSSGVTTKGSYTPGAWINMNEGTLKNFEMVGNMTDSAVHSGNNYHMNNIGTVTVNARDLSKVKVVFDDVALTYLPNNDVAASNLKDSNLHIYDEDGTNIDSLKNYVNINLGTTGNVNLPVEYGKSYTVGIEPTSSTDGNVINKTTGTFTVVNQNLNTATFEKESTYAGKNVEYTGEQITLDITKDNFKEKLGNLYYRYNGSTDQKLTEGVDYSTDIIYGQNTNAGTTGTITFTGLGSFAGSKKVITFHIVKRKIKSNDAVKVAKKVVYNPLNEDASDYGIVPEVTVTFKDTFNKNKEYTLTVPTADYDVVQTFKNGKKTPATDGAITTSVKIKKDVSSNFEFDPATLSGETAIVNKAITDADIVMNKTSYTYTGAEIALDYKVVVDGEELKKDVDYTAVVTNGTNVGDGILTITGKNDYDNTTATAKFTITPANTSDVKVTPKDDIIYDGTKHNPTASELKITLNGNDVSSQFKLTYPTAKTANVNAGNGTVTLTPVKNNKNFNGTADATFTIKPAELSDGTLTAYDAKESKVTWYNGSQPAQFTFDYDGTAKSYTKALYKAASSVTTPVTTDDYEVVYVDNTHGKMTYSAGKAGRAFALVVAKGNYKNTTYNANVDGTQVVKGGVYTCEDGTKISNVVGAYAFLINHLPIHKSSVTVENGSYKGGFNVDPVVTINYNGKKLVQGVDFDLDYTGITQDRTSVTNGKTLKVKLVAKGGYYLDSDIPSNYIWGIDKFNLANAEIIVSGTDADPVVKVMNGTVVVSKDEYTETAADGKLTITAKDSSKNYTGTQTVDIKHELEKPAAPMISDVKVVGNKATVILSGDSEGAAGYDYVISTDRDCITNKDYTSVNKNQVSTSTTFKYVQQGVYYAYCHAWKRNENGKKVFSSWSNAYPFSVTAITPDAPVITNVTVSGSTIKVTYKAAANATGYDVVLGTDSKKENGETRPYHYGNYKKLNLKEGTVTATFKNVPKGTWVVGMHAFNRTSEDGKKVFSPWSNLKKATVK